MATYEDDWPAWCNTQAHVEGWNLWSCDGSDYGSPQICRNDEMEIFEEDTDAWWHVLQHARGGSQCHKIALEVLKKHNPKEYNCVIEWGKDHN